MRTISSKSVTLAEVKDTLDSREKEGELGYEQKQAQDYATKFSKNEKKEAKTLVEKLMGNKKITRETAVTLVNIAPKYPEVVKTIAVKDKIELSEDEIEEILKLFK